MKNEEMGTIIKWVDVHCLPITLCGGFSKHVHSTIMILARFYVQANAMTLKFKHIHLLHLTLL
jgi:hypothetical protein